MIQTDLPNETGVTGRTVTINGIVQGLNYYKVAEITMPNVSDNKHIVFYVHDGMFSISSSEHKADGILNIMLRTGNPDTFTSYGDVKIEWLIAREHTDTEKFFLEVNDEARTVELWVQLTLPYSFQFTVLAEGDRLIGNKHYFTLYDKPQPGTPPTKEQGYRKVVSTVAKLLAPTEAAT